MARSYRRVDRDQGFLLPPDMREWLPDDHLVWFLIEVVESLDTTAFHRRGGRSWAGRARFDPDMMLTLLVYAYANGVLSSRRIESLCHTDVAFRIICGGDVPDHVTLARFRRSQLAAFADLFAQVLTLCAQAGMARVGLVAVDGTKIAANASAGANRSEAWLAEQARKLAAEAEAADDAEDDLFGPDRRGDEVPAELADPRTRAERIKALVDRANTDRDQRERAATEQDRLIAEHLAALALGRASRRAPAGIDPVEQARARVARERFRAATAQTRWQAKADAAAARGRRLPGSKPADPDDALPVRRAEQAVQDTLRQAQARTQQASVKADSTAVAKAGPEHKNRYNLSDPDSRIMPTRTGWVQGYNCQLTGTADHVILGVKVVQTPGDAPQFQPMLDGAVTAAARLAPHRPDPSDTSDTSDIAANPAEIGIALFDAGYLSKDNLTAPGPDRLIATGKHHQLDRAANQQPAIGAPPPDTGPIETMHHRLRTEEGAKIYKKRGATIEPLNGHIKDRIGLRRFSMRGLRACQAELELAAAVLNLLKLHRTSPTTA